jgi:DNA-binding MarR family transcriptional regulator
MDVDLRPLEFRVLLILVHRDGVSQEEIAEGLTIDKSVIARVVKNLIQNDYIVRKVNEEDRRAYCLFRTSKAIAFDETMMAILEEWEEIILEKVPEEERDRFSELMKDVFAHTKLTVKKIQQED